MLATWPLEDLWLQLSPRLPHISLELLPSIDSTNTELMRRARLGQTDPALLVAETQTAGRGRLGRQWVSSPGDSLTFSLGLMLSPADWSGLSLAVGVALVEALESALGVSLGLKWPNDVWCDHGHGPHKVGGILIETANPPDAQGPGTGRYAVIGVGLNIQTPQAVESVIPPLGLKALSDEVNAPQLLGQVIPTLVQTVLDFGDSGFQPLLARFNRHDLLLNQPVRLSDGREGVARGVDGHGVLQVDTASGREWIHSADISIRPRTD
jgi:BirA family biotin operon repressor/biotin-[acetyl-CoA-carboxylase] ligase